jgi:hypothetical protein
MLIRHEETVIEGRWSSDRGCAVKDGSCQRIELLVSTYLRKIAVADGGWATLFQDPQDNRLWELTYPLSEMHGGGPPTLRVLSRAEAGQRFSLAFARGG